MKYKYTIKNLLINPEKYQFSEFQGEIFLQLYYDNRKKFIKNNIILDLKKIKTLYDKNIIEDQLNLKTFLIDSIFSGNIDKRILLKLIQRFEVSKKLYKYYSIQDIRKSNDIYDDLDNYYLFAVYLSNIIQAINDKYLQVICFNALLKVNDILISVHNENDFLIYKNMLNYSVTNEINFYKILKGDA